VSAAEGRERAMVAAGSVSGDTTVLRGRRIVLRPLVVSDFGQWQEVRNRNRDWLTRWEPRRPAGQADSTDSRQAFSARCRARDRERQLGTGYGFGIFLPGEGGPRASTGGRFCGEININTVQRGPFQSAYVGYWIDEATAGRGYVPEAVVAVLRYAFEQLRLHRIQIAIIPRNQASRRVVEKLRLREEGLAVRYLEINGTWEDHLRFAITAEEWQLRRGELLADWIYPDT
jgi:[ribosomal protein S5]-alanine N-acetyltransferase